MKKKQTKYIEKGKVHKETVGFLNSVSSVFHNPNT